MPKVTFILADGRQQKVQGTEGSSVMLTATSAGVPGIVAECGGSAMCATCHVYVEPTWFDRLPEALPNELEMLECTASERLSNSRLSCQIKLSASLDGITLRIPERQQ